MTARYEIKAWRKSANDKAYTVRLGSAWTDQKGVLRLAFDALPLPDEQGRVSCFLEQPRERPETAPERQEVGAQGFARQMAPERASHKPIPLGGDEIPF
jgi:hypothetical protein